MQTVRKHNIYKQDQTPALLGCFLPFLAV